MRALISALAVAGLFAFALPGYADEVKAGGPSAKPGRTIDDGAVKSGGATDKPGRAIEDNGEAGGNRRTSPVAPSTMVP